MKKIRTLAAAVSAICICFSMTGCGNAGGGSSEIYSGGETTEDESTAVRRYVPDIRKNLDNSFDLNVITLNGREIDLNGCTLKDIEEDETIGGTGISESITWTQYDDYYFYGREFRGGNERFGIEFFANDELIAEDFTYGIGHFTKRDEDFNPLYEYDASECFVKGITIIRRSCSKDDYLTLSGGVHLGMSCSEIEEIYGKAEYSEIEIPSGKNKCAYYKNKTASVIIFYPIHHDDDYLVAEKIAVILN